MKATCSECNGTGKITKRGKYVSYTTNCSKCNGVGKVNITNDMSEDYNDISEDWRSLDAGWVVPDLPND